jgi:cell division protease FtsH
MTTLYFLHPRITVAANATDYRGRDGGGMGKRQDLPGGLPSAEAGNGHKKLATVDVPDLDSRRRESLRKQSSPLRRTLIFLKRFAPVLIALAAGALLYLDATILNAFLLALNFVWQLVFGILIMLVQFVSIFWFMSRSRVERIRPEDPKVITFDDYWGQSNLKALVRQWLGLLSDREVFVRMGGRYINGLLLFGEPGTGKTMLAKAMAGEAGVAFISMEGSGFRNMFWGVDTLKMMWFVRKARKLARRYGAAIAYIDEIDAVGASRGNVMGGRGGGGGGMGAMGMMGMGGSGALTRLLYEMDGLGVRSFSERMRAKAAKLLGRKPPQRKWHVLFMGSTNRPDVLDPALVRPGRFDQLIQVNPPDKAGRREIVQGYLQTIRHDDSVDVEAIVSDTAKSTPAQIMAALTKDAVRIALFDGHPLVTQRDIERAFLQQWMGIENPIEEMAEDQRRQIAVHEAGHAVAQHYLLPDQRIVHLTIVARAQSLGFMLPLDQVEMYAYPLRRIVADIMVGMAGHVATRVVFGEEWTGAYSDFQQARAHLRHLQSLGFFGPPVTEPSPETAGRTEKMLADFWKDLEARVETLLRSHCGKVIALAESLLKRSSLSRSEILAVLEPGSSAPAEEGAETAAAAPAPACSELDLVAAST